MVQSIYPPAPMMTMVWSAPDPPTDAAMSCVNALIEVSTNGSTWYDVSGSVNSVAPASVTRGSGEAYTFSGDGAVVTAGNKEPVDVTVRAIYTEVDGEAFARALAVFEAWPGSLYLRWCPHGGTAGDARYVSGNSDNDPARSLVSSLNWPGPDAASASPLLVEFVVHCQNIVSQRVMA